MLMGLLPSSLGAVVSSSVSTIVPFDLFSSSSLTVWVVRVCACHYDSSGYIGAR